MSKPERSPAGSATGAAVARATWNGVLLAQNHPPGPASQAQTVQQARGGTVAEVRSATAMTPGTQG